MNCRSTAAPMAHPAAMLACCTLVFHPRSSSVASTTSSQSESLQNAYLIGPNRRWSRREFVPLSSRSHRAAAAGSKVRSGRPREADFIVADDEEEEVGPNVVPAPPPSTGRIDIVVDKTAIQGLDLSPAHTVLRQYVHRIGDNITEPPSNPQELLDRTVGFVLKYERDDPLDPRELSEMPDIRLWFVRLDAAYPWLPVVLDWKAGELARYAAMLVPHQMSKKQGLVFNPEALELFAMNKVFVIHPWLRARGMKNPNSKLTNMMRMIGLGVSKEFYGLINRHPPPT